MLLLQLRDREMELKAQISAITAGGKETQRAEAESGEGGSPLVEESDIATVVSQWTRIPVEKVHLCSQWTVSRCYCSKCFAVMCIAMWQTSRHNPACCGAPCN